MNRAVFLDRDGVINENRPNYVRSIDQLHYLPGALDAVRQLAATDYKIIIVTNQSAVGRGILTLQQAEAINAAVVDAVEAHGGRVDAAYLCPAHPDAGDPCRKPRPGMLLRAAETYHLDLSRSIMIGDAVTDYEAACAAGVTGWHILTGRGRQQMPLFARKGYQSVAVYAGLPEAVDALLALP